MSHKNFFQSQFNFQSSNPQTNFLPVNNLYGGGSQPSGTAGGSMASTNTIYSNIINRQNMDNHGIELNWTGTPTGTLSVLVSNSGKNWTALSFNPGITQPAGSAATTYINIQQLAAKYIMLQYVNASGSGTLTAYLTSMDLN